MLIRGIPAGLYSTECPYLPEKIFTSENILVQEIDDEGLDYLLSMGFRHFGEHFFRPICDDCHQCIPIRIPVEGFSPSRNLRRVRSKGSELTSEISEPQPSREKYELYNAHSLRFDQRDNAGYERFSESFFHMFRFSRELRLFDDELIGVSHFDMTAKSLSAVYCYWESSASVYSPGTLAVLRQMEYAREMGISHVYLGYYVPLCRHMNYKARFRPNELLLSEFQWIPFTDAEAELHGFIPRTRLVWENDLSD